MMRLFLVICIMLFLLIPLTACNSDSEIVAEGKLVEIARWSGKSMTTTAPFTIESKPWFLIWAHNPSSYGGYFCIDIYDIDSWLPIQMVANSFERDSGTSAVYHTGTFYLDITAVSTSWAISISIYAEE